MPTIAAASLPWLVLLGLLACLHNRPEWLGLHASPQRPYWDDYCDWMEIALALGCSVGVAAAVVAESAMRRGYDGANAESARRKLRATAVLGAATCAAIGAYSVDLK